MHISEQKLGRNFEKNARIFNKANIFFTEFNFLVLSNTCIGIEHLVLYIRPLCTYESNIKGGISVLLSLYTLML